MKNTVSAFLEPTGASQINSKDQLQTTAPVSTYRNAGVLHLTHAVFQPRRKPSTSHPFQNTIRHNVARLSQRDLQLKMPGGGCSVTRRQFSSSLLSPQSFCWLQTSEPRYKHLPLVQVNLHSEKARNKAWGSQRSLGTQKQSLPPPPTCRVQAMRLSR